MRPDDWHLTTDVDHFLTRAGGFLRSDPGRHVMQLTWAERVRARGGAGFFGVLEDRDAPGGVAGTCYLLPPGALGLGPLSAPQAEALAVRLAGAGHAPARVSADHDTAAAFAAAWCRQRGVTAERRATRLVLYRLGSLVPPQPQPAGRIRFLGDGDLAEAVEWCRGFAAAVEEDASFDAASWSGTRYADKRYALWETPDGTPVSVAGLNPLIGGQIQVDIVYTPAHLRGHGYAAAVTAAVSRAALKAGARDVVLFADAANPTSNALYQRLGYEAAAHWSVYDFLPGEATIRESAAPGAGCPS
jgi:RimJ/RimL family protein N-acetyltransferase